MINARMIKSLTLPGLEVAWATHKGKVREENEDSIGVKPLPDNSGVFLVVSDGLGGRNGGKVASTIVCKRMLESATGLSPDRPLIERFDALLATIYYADRKVRERAARDLRLIGMGATVVAAAVTPQTVLHLHSGDSRLYHFRGGQRLYRTQDHSAVEVMRQVGQLQESEMWRHPSRNILLASVGEGNQKTQIDVAPKWQEGADEQEAELALQSGDVVMLCTDGLNGVIGEGKLTEIVNAEGDRKAAEQVEQLVEAALAAGGEDNVTVAVVKIN